MGTSIGYGHRVIPPPAWLDALRAGETDGRFIDLTNDLGPAGDSIANIGAVTVSIARQDGATITASDLKLAGSPWPNGLDETGLIVTVGLTAPAGSAGVDYRITISANTKQGRIFIRDVVTTVASALG